MDSIVTAGGRSKPEDPLFEVTGIEKKALIPLAGRPMIAWVVDAVWKSGMVENIAIVGLQPGEVDFGDAPVCYTDAVGDMVSNVLTGLDRLREVNPAVQKVLLASSDVPLVTPEIIEGFVEECGSLEADGYYAVIEEKTMEARFPDSKRMFVPFKGGRYAGGDVLLVDVAAVKANQQFVRGLTSSRKDYWGQARMLGLSFILRFLFRMMTVHEAAAEAAKKANLDAKVVDTQYAELGMDLDKPAHYQLITSILENREL
jgi:GTP:adenosylcobinamide-phosphate guanylyltransferase